MTDLDLTLTRHMAAAPERVWRAWTEPELLKRWFAPAPVVTREAVIELRPGGRFHVMMVAPDGTEYPNEGCVLLIEPGRRLIFTECLTEGFRPVVRPVLPLTIEIRVEPEGTGTRYTARALHGDAATRQEHADKGFEMGWGLATEQLAAVAGAL